MDDKLPTLSEFTAKAEEAEADAALQFEGFFAAAADFLDGCALRGELSRSACDEVKAVLSRHLNSGKQVLRDKIEQAKATLFLHGDEPRGSENDG